MQDYSQPIVTHKTPHKSVGFMYVLPLGLLVGFIVFVVVFFFKNGSALNLSALSQPTPSPTAFLIAPASPNPTVPESSPTPTPIDASAAAQLKKDLQVLVLNGSGKSGVAAKAKKILTDAGYKRVTTSNSVEFDYTNVTIRYVKEAAAAIPLLKKDLEENYTIEETEEADLTGTTDIEIIIGE